MKERTQNFGPVMKESYLLCHLSYITHSLVRSRMSSWERGCFTWASDVRILLDRAAAEERALQIKEIVWTKVWKWE